MPRLYAKKWKRRLIKRENHTSDDFMAAAPDDDISKVLAIEDLSFMIVSYLGSDQQLDSTAEVLGSLVRVSRTWNRVFSLVRAQLRWDCITNHLPMEDGQWLFHKVIYISSPSDSAPGCRSIPPEGLLRIFRSCVNDACNQAMRDYHSDRSNDEHGDDERIDSRPDYYYRAHQETPTCLEVVPPKALPWTDNLNIVNEIEHDQKPRLISQYRGTIDDVNGIENKLNEMKSKEGAIDLGYHEILSIRNCKNAMLNPRPPLNGKGQDSSDYINACNAKAFMPRWVKFAHVVGQDKCRMFVHKSLLPMIGARPTGQNFGRCI